MIVHSTMYWHIIHTNKFADISHMFLDNLSVLVFSLM